MEINAPRRELALETLWDPPPGCEWHGLVSATDASRPPLETHFTLFHDTQKLYVLFTLEDDHVVSTMFEHDAPLYEEDALEVFVAPADIRVYYEFEVNLVGTMFDARVESPDGHRETMRVDRAWNCEGLWCAARRDRLDDGERQRVIVAIPFAPLGGAPLAGSAWRANFFRIDRHPRRDMFAAWSATMKQPADFHVPARFGTIRFE